MKLLLPSLFLINGLLIVSAPGTFAAQDTAPPGNYKDQQLNPNGSPPAPVGNDLLLCEDVPGVVQLGPIDQNGNYVAPFKTVPAAQVAVKLNIGGLGYVPLQGATTVPPAVPVSTVQNVTGPTGTYAGGDIGAGKHTENTKTDIHKYILAGVVYYQYEFSVTWTDQATMTSHTKSVFAGINSYSMP